MRIWGLGVLIALVAISSQAQEVSCGTDSSSIGAWIKFPTVYENEWTPTGCSAGQVRKCQSDGSFGSCINLSSFTCHTGSGSTYWFATTGDNATGNGSYSNPWEDYRKFSYGAGGGHTPSAGNCYVFRGGTYTATYTYSSKYYMAYIRAVNGTSSNRITLRGAPGEVVKFQASNNAEPIYIENAQYWTISNIEIPAQSSDVTEAGIRVPENGHYTIIERMYIHDLDGNNDNNPGGILFFSSNNGTIRRNYIVDVFDRDNGSVASAAISTGTVTNLLITQNWIEIGTTDRSVMGIKNKFGGASDTMTVSYNTIKGFTYAGVATRAAGLTLTRNLFINCRGGVQFSGSNLNEPSYLSNHSVTYNTFVGLAGSGEGWFMKIDYYDGTTSGVTVENNIAVANRNSSWTSDGTGMVRLIHYANSTQYADFIPNKWGANYNCYWNVGSAGLTFDVGGGYSNPPGGYFTFSQYQSEVSSKEANSYAEDPNFDSDYRAQSANCKDKGYAQLTGGSARFIPLLYGRQ